MKKAILEYIEVLRNFILVILFILMILLYVESSLPNSIHYRGSQYESTLD
jgi:hypothetical protein